MPDGLEQRKRQGGEVGLVLTGRLSPDGRALHLATPEGALPALALPTHVWGFDLVSLNFALRHRVDPTRDFEVGLVEPNRPGEGGQPFAVGTLQVRYRGEEWVNGVACRRYALVSAVLGGAEGSMWVAKDGEHIVRAEHPVRISTDWKDFRLELQRVEPMDALAWQKLEREVLGGAGAAGPSLASRLNRAHATGGLKALRAAHAQARKERAAAAEADLAAVAAALAGREAHADALAVLELGLEEHPQSVLLQGAFAELLQEAGRAQEAKAAWERLLQLDPRNEAARKNQGRP